MILTQNIKQILSKSSRKLHTGFVEFDYLIELLGKNTTCQEYKLFYLKKKSGGQRQIAEPCKQLLDIQRYIKLYLCETFTPNEAANGFINGKSIVSNAQCHVNKNFVYCLDIKSFFNTINADDISSCLQSYPFDLCEEDANILAFLCTYSYPVRNDDGDFVIETELPQGAPTSPILSNIVFDEYDTHISALAKQYKVTYTRYADDMTFSSNINKFTEENNFRNKIFEIFRNSKFTLNNDKTRLLPYWKKQIVTGLVVNDGVNVSRKFIKEVRSLLHVWRNYGVYDAAWTYCKHHTSNERDCVPQYFMRVLLGKIMFIRMVRGENDDLVNTLIDEFNDLYASTTDEKLVFHNKKKHFIHEIELANGEFFYVPNCSKIISKHPDE